MDPSSLQKLYEILCGDLWMLDFCHSVQGSTFKGGQHSQSLFQNQLDTSAPLLYALQTSEAIFKTGFLSVYARGCNPSSLPPQVKQYGQFSHISTCILLCTSHNWSMTVTSCIRCFSIYFLHRFYAINVT